MKLNRRWRDCKHFELNFSNIDILDGFAVFGITQIERHKESVKVEQFSNLTNLNPKICVYFQAPGSTGGPHLCLHILDHVSFGNQR